MLHHRFRADTRRALEQGVPHLRQHDLKLILYCHGRLTEGLADGNRLMQQAVVTQQDIETGLRQLGLESGATDPYGLYGVAT